MTTRRPALSPSSQGAPGGPTGGVPRPAPNAPYHPGADTATYRDLLLFEERLKMNAEMLRKRRRRYNAFLWSFVGALAWLLHRLFFIPIPNHLTMRALQASTAVVVITLGLFFASGMYEEKIRYATSYINHSNKALRPLNMHLNMRRPPASFPIPFLRTKPSAPPLQAPPTQKTGPLAARRPSTSSTVMATIPPSSNPRGELIFSSRVDKTFREGYERYRAAFERRREEKAREEALRNAKWYQVGVASRASTPNMYTPTPPGSRRGTPPPSSSAGNGQMLAGTTGPDRRRTPSPGMHPSRLKNSIDWTGDKDGKRERAESYSFVWGKEGDAPRRAP